jgi:hypothetical protein
MAAFAHTGEHHPSGAPEQGADGFFKVLVNSIGGVHDGLRLDPKHGLAKLNGVCGDGLHGVWYFGAISGLNKRAKSAVINPELYSGFAGCPRFGA